MDNATKLLRLSLKQDLLRLNEVVKNISKDNEALVEIRSWFFPTKNHDFVEEFIANNRIFETGTERLFLELIIDRVYVGIRLLLTGNQQFPLRKCIISPPEVTLGFCFEKLYHLIFQMKELGTSTSIREGNPSFSIVHRESQTDITSLNRCDSCASAITCMKCLMNIFENDDFQHIFEGRKFKPQILDITQFGCMLQTTTAITDNFKKLFEKISSKEEEIRILKNEKSTQLKVNLNQKKKIVHLKEEVRIYEQEYEKSTSKICLLSNENKELSRGAVQNDLHLKSLENTINNFSATLAKRNVVINNLKSENAILKRQLEGINGNQKILSNLVILLRKDVKKVLDDLSRVGEILAPIERTIDNLNSRLHDITNLNENSRLKVKNMTKDFRTAMDSIYDYLVDKNNDLKTKLKEYFDQLTKKFHETNSHSNMQVKGDPVEDISYQMKENEGKIRALQVENQKLENILTKFKDLRPI